jgi:ubiquitin carboxyl-terminal hydrolase L5
MNIINNRQDVQLGEQLEQFRTSTAQLSSKDRGLALDAFDHVRNIHNSFAT